MRSTYGSGDRLETPRSGLPGAALPQSPGKGPAQADAEDQLLFRGWNSGVNCDACLVPIAFNVSHD